MIVHKIITPENVPLSYRVAGMGARFLAWLADMGLLAVLAAVGLGLALALDLVNPGVGTAFFLIWIFILVWGYFLLFEWLWLGQTPGKRAVGIRVIQARGTSMSFAQAAVRNILRVVDALPVLFYIPLFYGLGFIVAACNREHRRLGDLAAGTLVVHVERKPRPVQALPGRASEADRIQRGLLRQRLGQLDRQQKQTLMELCVRRDQLRVRERARLFHAAAEYFKTRLELAPREFQSDEKFILELADVLNAETGPEGLRGPGPGPREGAFPVLLTPTSGPLAPGEDA
jgi:uncharacterized RDD family membrane protein YckC